MSVDPRGLLPISQQSLTVYNSVAYHEYEGVFFWADEEQRLVESIGDKSILILKNHGLVATANNIASCFSRMYMLESACAIQCKAVDNPILIDQQSINRSMNQSLEGSNSRSTVLMWKSLLRKLEKSCPEYKN